MGSCCSCARGDKKHASNNASPELTANSSTGDRRKGGRTSITAIGNDFLKARTHNDEFASKGKSYISASNTQKKKKNAPSAMTGSFSQPLLLPQGERKLPLAPSSSSMASLMAHQTKGEPSSQFFLPVGGHGVPVLISPAQAPAPQQVRVVQQQQAQRQAPKLTHPSAAHYAEPRRTGAATGRRREDMATDTTFDDDEIDSTHGEDMGSRDELDYSLYDDLESPKSPGHSQYLSRQRRSSGAEPFEQVDAERRIESGAGRLTGLQQQVRQQQQQHLSYMPPSASLVYMPASVPTSGSALPSGVPTLQEQGSQQQQRQPIYLAQVPSYSLQQQAPPGQLFQQQQQQQQLYLQQFYQQQQQQLYLQQYLHQQQLQQHQMQRSFNSGEPTEQSMRQFTFAREEKDHTWQPEQGNIAFPRGVIPLTARSTAPAQPGTIDTQFYPPPSAGQMFDQEHYSHSAEDKGQQDAYYDGEGSPEQEGYDDDLSHSPGAPGAAQRVRSFSNLSVDYQQGYEGEDSQLLPSPPQLIDSSPSESASRRSFFSFNGEGVDLESPSPREATTRAMFALSPAEQYQLTSPQLIPSSPSPHTLPPSQQVFSQPPQKQQAPRQMMRPNYGVERKSPPAQHPPAHEPQQQEEDEDAERTESDEELEEQRSRSNNSRQLSQRKAAFIAHVPEQVLDEQLTQQQRSTEDEVFL